MKQTLKLFQIEMVQISKDGMLFVLLPAPLMIGILFKFVIPVVNNILGNKVSFSLIPWYGLIDGMLMCLTPMLTAMAFAFLLLEERDEGIGAFYQVSPAGGYYYLFARIGIPMIWALIATIIAATLFQISQLSAGAILFGSLLSTLTGTALAMMLVSLAGNRVEGLALSKLMGVTFIGLVTVWFIPVPYQYCAAFLPTYWIGKIIFDGAALHELMFGLLSCFIWITIFTKKFLSRIG